MDILYLLFIVICAYFLIVFFILRLVAPFMGFGKYQLPADLPSDIKQTIADLESTPVDQMSYLKNVYDFILAKNSKQWRHSRFKAGTHLHRLFVEDLSEIWDTNEFVYCQAINFVVFVMLANSKFFKTDDVRSKYSFLNFVIHQYLQVRVGEEWVDVDPAGSGIRGQPLGNHSSIFG